MEQKTSIAGAFLCHFTFLKCIKMLKTIGAFVLNKSLILHDDMHCLSFAIYSGI